MRKAILLLIVMMHSYFTNAQVDCIGIDSLLQKVNVMWVENPMESKVIATNIAIIANNSQNSICKVKAYLAKSKSSQALGLDDEALVFLDSAIDLANSSQNSSIQADVLLYKLKYSLQVDNENMLNSTIQHIDNLLKVQINPSLDVRKSLVLGDYFKQKSLINDAIKQKEQALEKAIAFSNDTLIAECQQSIGSTYWFFGNFKQALVYYSEAQSGWKKIGSVDGKIDILKNIGLTYRSLGQYDAAYDSFTSAIDLAVEFQDKVEEATILNLIGGLNLNSNKLDEALENFEDSFTIFESEEMQKSSVATLLNIARTFAKKSAFNVALKYLQNALALQEQLMDPITESSIINEIGNLNLQKGDITESLKYYLMSLKIRKECANNELIAKSLVNIGIAFRRLGMLGNAAKYLEQVVDLIDGNFMKSADAAYAMQNLAHVYCDQGDFDIAISTYKKSLSLVERTGDELQMCRLLCNIAQAQIKNMQYEEARASLTQALKISLKKGSDIDVANIYNELGNVERCKSSYQHAIVFYKKSADLYKKIQNEAGRALCLRKIGEVQVEQGDFIEAEQNINESIEIGGRIENAYLQQFGYLAKYEMYKAKGGYRNALESYIKYVGIKDSIQSNSRSEKSIEAQIDLELDQKATEIKLMEAEMEALKNKNELDNANLEKQAIIRNFLIVFIVLVALIAGISVIALIQKRRHARSLEEKIVEINLVNNKLVQSERELKETIQTKDKLFSIVAHDLRSPFTALVGLTEIMANQSDRFSKEEMVDFSKLVNSSAESVLSLIENLLHWSRTQTGRLILNPESVNLLTLVNKVVETAKIAADAKKIDISVNIDSQQKILVDNDTITAVIRNLLSNAIKFTPEKGQINISSSLVDSMVVVRVADTGVGISSSNLERLFKIDGITTKGTNDEGGTGLGLVVCKEFVEKNGGTINVESEVGKGTTFVIRLKSV